MIAAETSRRAPVTHFGAWSDGSMVPALSLSLDVCLCVPASSDPGILKGNDLVDVVFTLGVFCRSHGDPGQIGGRRLGRERGHGCPDLRGGRLYLADCVCHAPARQLSGIFGQDM